MPKAYLEFVDKFVDLLLHPENRWLRCYFLCGGFTYSVGSVRKLVTDILDETTQTDGFLMKPDLVEALKNKDKAFLVEHIKRDLVDTRPRPDSLSRMINALESRHLRKEAEGLARIFQTHRGPKPKITREQVAELSRIADEIAPVIEKILVERSHNTKNTLDEMLGFWRNDHPEGCDFLMNNKLLFEKALADPKLLARAKTNLQKRARVLAYGLAGSEFDLTFRYSHDLVRAQGKPTKHEPKIAS